MFKGLGEIIADGPKGLGRPGEPVRRHSHKAGRCEGTFWNRTGRQEARRIYMAAKRYDVAERRDGIRPLGPVAIEILDLFSNLMDARTGRLDPSIEWLKAKLGRSRDAIVRALKALRAHGFLDWLRRYVETGNEGRGPRVQQTSNAYRLSMPARALRLLGRAGKPAPAPEDFAHARAARAEERAAQEASLTFEEYARHTVEDEGLAAMLARLGASIQAQQRESAARTESATGIHP